MRHFELFLQCFLSFVLHRKQLGLLWAETLAIRCFNILNYFYNAVFCLCNILNICDYYELRHQIRDILNCFCNAFFRLCYIVNNQDYYGLRHQLLDIFIVYVFLQCTFSFVCVTSYTTVILHIFNIFMKHSFDCVTLQMLLNISPASHIPRPTTTNVVHTFFYNVDAVMHVQYTEQSCTVCPATLAA